MPTNSPRTALRTAGNKVPEVTPWFWIVKVLATTVGETIADFLNDTLGLGLSATSIVMTVLLVVVLVAQFRSRAYRPPLYWLSVVLISVVGTLLTDNLSDNLGVPLPVSTAVFAALLAVTFVVWRHREGTLSIHAVDTRARESFYWAAILFTFALGTAAGDLIAEQVGLGYPASVGLFALAIALVAVARYGVGVDAVATFWAAYVLTRPLGASLGDLLSQARSDGGLGLGTTGTSLLFLVTIAAIVVHLTRSRVDRPASRPL